MRKQPVFMLFVATVLLLAGGVQAEGSDTIEANKALTRRVFDEILNRERYELFSSIYLPDFVKHVDGRSYSLAEEVEDAKSMRVSLSDLVMTIDMMIAEGDKVAILYTGRGTNDGPFSGMPPTGKKLEASGTTIYRIADNKIAEEWTTYNMLEILSQLGYYPEPDKN